jgi:hypothetical protein
MKTNKFPWTTAFILLGCAVCGVAASFPFVTSMYADKLADSPLPLPLVFGLALLQNSILLFGVVAGGLFFTAKVGLPGTPLIDDWRAGKTVRERFLSLIQPALITGFSVGFAVILLSSLLLKKELPHLPFGKAGEIPVWKRFLLCFYGGLTEEILMRIFLLSLLVWILSKIWRGEAGKPQARALWTGNVVVALLFGLGHLGSVVLLMPITTNIVIAAMLLNGIASLAFTTLYIKRGLEAAILAHFTADLLIWVIGPSFIFR